MALPIGRGPPAETDEQRTVTKRNSYAPYGEAYAPTVIDGTGYTGHVMDQATGLTYMQQRYYDPQIGRFLSPDPVRTDTKTGGNFNRYWYANDNSYRFADPDGRYSCEGSKCKQLDAAIAKTNAKIDAMKDGSTKTSLQEQARAIGTNGDGQGPKYATDGKRTGTIAGYDQDSGVTTVHIPNGTDASVTGSSVHHEFSHETDDKARGRAATTRNEIVQTETKAYGMTRDVLSAFGITVSPEHLQESLDQSVANDIENIENAMHASGLTDFKVH